MFIQEAENATCALINQLSGYQGLILREWQDLCYDREALNAWLADAQIPLQILKIQFNASDKDLVCYDIAILAP